MRDGCTRVRACSTLHDKGAAHEQPRDVLGEELWPRAAMPSPLPRPVRGDGRRSRRRQQRSGGGPGEGFFGGHGPVQWEGGLQTVSDAGGSSG